MQAEFRRVFRTKKNSFLETKNKNVRFIGELTKFSVCPLPTTFKCVVVVSWSGVVGVGVGGLGTCYAMCHPGGDDKHL